VSLTGTRRENGDDCASTKGCRMNACMQGFGSPAGGPAPVRHGASQGVTRTWPGLAELGWRGGWRAPPRGVCSLRPGAEATAGFCLLVPVAGLRPNTNWWRCGLLPRCGAPVSLEAVAARGCVPTPFLPCVVASPVNGLLVSVLTHGGVGQQHFSAFCLATAFPSAAGRARRVPPRGCGALLLIRAALGAPCWSSATCLSNVYLQGVAGSG